MKRITQICLMICGISLGLGVLFLIVGTVMGARPRQYLNLARVEPWSHMLESYVDRIDIIDELDDWKDLDIVDELDDLDVLDEFAQLGRDSEHWAEGRHREEHSGGSPNGGSSATGVDYDATFSDGVEELELSISHGEIHFYGHEEQGIRVCAPNAGSVNAGGTFQCWQDDEKLLIQDTRKAKEEKLELEIYLPERELHELEVDMGAGTLEAGVFRAREVSLDMGAGNCEIEQMFASEKAEFSAGAGRIQVGLFTGKDLEVSCGAGEINLCLAGVYEDYDYEVESAIGQIVLGGKSFGGFAYDQDIDNGAPRKVELDCGVGRIEVTFSENGE